MPADATPRETASLFLPLYLPAFLFSLSSSLLIPVLPLFAQGFKVSYGLIGLVLAGESIGMLCGDLPAGMLMRRLGQKNAMLAGLVLSGASTALLFFAGSVAAVLLLRVISGLGVALFSVSRHYFMTEMAPLASRGRVISIFGGLFRLGRLTGPLAGGLVATSLGLRVSFLVFGVICLAALVIVINYLPHIEVDRPGEVEMLVSPAAHIFQVLRSHYRILSTAGFGVLFLQMLRSGPTAIIPLYAANYLGLSVERIGLVMSASALLELAMFLPAGLLMDRLGRKFAIIPSCIGLAAGLALIPLTRGFSGLLLASALGGLGGGLSSGAVLTTGSDLAPKKGRSEFLGAWTLVGDIGGTAGPLVVGGMADLMPLPQTGWLIALAGVAAALIFGFLVPETLKKKPALPRE